MSDTGRVTHSPITLTPWARRSSGVVGVVSAGLGAWSVFLNTNQAGSAALLLLGALFILMAMSGRVPDRITKEGIEHDSVSEAFEDLLDHGSPEVKKEAAEALIRKASESVNTASPPPATEEPVGSRNRRLQTMARYINLESSVVDAIQQEFHTAEDDRVWRDLDCVVLENGHAPIGVEVKAVGDPRNLRRATLRLAELVKAEKIGAGVIVSVGTDSDSRRFPLFPEEVTIVSIDDHGVGEVSSTDADRIREVIRSALETV